jgi:acetamidase/formamidase
VAPPDGYFPPLSPGVTNAVPPGPHAGNLDLSELAEGSTLYVPVWKPGALIYTGDSHAVQGDGEICLTAVETRMRELQIQVIRHKQKRLAWPLAETDTHWIAMGLDRDLNAAMTLAARNAIKFLAAQAKISELDAYALCSVAVSFRVTQVVDIVRGVHALIPKNIFASELRQQMKNGVRQRAPVLIQTQIFCHSPHYAKNASNYEAQSSSKAFASFRSSVSCPSVNQP